jgi:hypothetical protein
MSIAIITGASSGMGEEFARRLDSYGLDCIWLVARRRDRMESLASELKTPVRIFSVDLTDRAQLDSFVDAVREESPSISYLVNCAGFGKFGMTWELPIESTRGMIDLNVTALVTITSGCIPYMAEGGHIIELDSLSAYIGMYDLNVYASTKAFVKHFCNGLRKELEPRKVSVTEVSPGWVRTDFIDITVTEYKVPQRVFKDTVSKEDVVDQALKAADRGKARSICGWKNHGAAFLSTHFPNFAARTWRGYFR